MKESLGLRLTIIAVLTIVLLVPAFLIEDLIRERKDRRDNAADEISSKWGDDQTLIGPVLTIPFKETVTIEEKTETRIRYAHFLPEELNVNGAIYPETRYRGIFEAVIYESDIEMSGYFMTPDLTQFNVPKNNFLPDQAFITLGISDMKGISEFISLTVNKTTLEAEPGVESTGVVESGITFGPNGLDIYEAMDFEMKIDLNGSDFFYISPVGKETKMTLTSDWTNPSFNGDFLPVERSVTEDGFSASWKVLHLNRNFPQQFLHSNNGPSRSSFGVDLMMAIDTYQKTMRTAKYAIMFISLTFLTFFMIELLSQKVIHPIQYLLIGLALLVFYTLLLSLSEHISFDMSYLIASTGIISMISLYAASFLKNVKQTVVVFGILIILYIYLYILLQLQDFALLMGSISLFVVLGVLMYVTRNIDWFNTLKGTSLNRKIPK
jgi:inner membrane protein